MKIHPLVPLTLTIAASAVPFAGSTPLRNDRRLQDGDSGIDYIEPLVNAEDEVDEARKSGGTPKVIVGNAEGNISKKGGGSLEELKIVSLVVPARGGGGNRVEIFSTEKYTLEAICRRVFVAGIINADVRLFIKHPLEEKDLEDLLDEKLYVSQVAQETNYIPRFTILNESTEFKKHSIPLVSAEYRFNQNKHAGYQLYAEPGDDPPSGPLNMYGYWGDHPGTSRFSQDTVTYPFEVAMPPGSKGDTGVLTGTGAFGRIQTSEGFHVEFTTANGNGVFAGDNPTGPACFFSGDVTYTKMKK